MHERLTIGVLALGLTVSCAFGQTSRPDEPPKQDAGEVVEGDRMLSGPVVDRAAETGRGPNFAGGDQRRGTNVSSQQWFRIVRRMELPDERRAAIDAILEEYERAGRAYTRTHGERAQELQRTIRTARREGRDVPPELMVEAAELRNLQPKVETYQQRIWTTLSDEEQVTLRGQLDRVIAQQRARRAAQQQTDRPITDRIDAMTDAAPTDAAPERRPRYDALGERRLAFLRAHQRQSRRGAGPTDAERVFEFDEEDGG